jgi:hypothetical protein
LRCLGDMTFHCVSLSFSDSDGNSSICMLPLFILFFSYVHFLNPDTKIHNFK